MNDDAVPENQSFDAPVAEIQNSPVNKANLKVRKYKYTDPISWYNLNKCIHAKELLRKAERIMLSGDKSNSEKWKGSDDDNVSEIIGHDRYLSIFIDIYNRSQKLKMYVCLWTH